MDTSIDQLRDHLARIVPGRIADLAAIRRLLAECWDELEGSDQAAMDASKLNRAEDLEWQPPKLSFTIERHGATVLGSSRAELQCWTVDINTAQASHAEVGYRQLSPMQLRLDVRPIADELVSLIRKRRKDSRLDWRDAKTVRVLMGRVLPSDLAARGTVAGRRRRLARALTEKLRAEGWIPVEGTLAHTYRKATRK